MPGPEASCCLIGTQACSGAAQRTWPDLSLTSPPLGELFSPLVSIPLAKTKRLLVPFPGLLLWSSFVRAVIPSSHEVVLLGRPGSSFPGWRTHLFEPWQVLTSPGAAAPHSPPQGPSLCPQREGPGGAAGLQKGPDSSPFAGRAGERGDAGLPP